MAASRIYLVERFVERITAETLDQLAERTRLALPRIAACGLEVAYLGSAAIPQDETCFCLYTGLSLEDAERLALEVGPAPDRIVEALMSPRRR
jgi:hypothetical protein